MKQIRLSTRTIKTIISIVVCCLLYIVVNIIAYYCKLQDLHRYFIPLISALVAYYCTLKKVNDYKVKMLAKYISYLLVLLFSFIFMYLYETFTKNAWPYMLLKEPITLIYPTIYVCFGAIVLSILTFLFNRKKELPSYMTLFIVIVSVNFYELDLVHSLLSLFISISTGFIVSYIVNTFRLNNNKNKEILFIYCLDGFNKKYNDKLDNYEKTLLEELIYDECSISFYSRFTLPFVSNVLNDIKIENPILCDNGAILYDFNNQEVLYNETIDYKTSKDLNKFLDSKNINNFKTYVYDNLYYICNNYPLNICEIKYKELVKNASFSNFVNIDKTNHLLTSIKIFGLKDYILNLENELKNEEFYDEIYIRVDNMSRLLELEGYFSLTIYSNNINKLNALDILANKKTTYTVSYTNKDYLLLNKSDYIITTKSSSSDVKFKANYIINSKRKHSLVRVIKKMYYKKIRNNSKNESMVK